MTVSFDFTRRFEWTGRTLTMLCDRYGDGASFATVASELGCTRNAAIGRFNRLLEEAYALPIGPQFADMLADGLSLNTIADRYGISTFAVMARLANVRRALGPQAR